ncbi:unnamed protein product [Kuraishia capsulata CBS 1993]|uniref:HTH APSES-type domain-containing protein n=1 Tax=Kuraishia capsulata CBS 1993 TaxID=1382522 RepID=W6MIZ7_9ASCO|nr:uncharacterized protein KUCA_T00002137001 [Kuraishia capsulata CBS 1993]CDK26166.1 unnamed protein product [Kuraishia capsulata CBS 1993]
MSQNNQAFYPNTSGGASYYSQEIPQPRQPFPVVGQDLPPPPDGSKPRISITFWEDENTLCYQVDARGIPVSRRQDTNFINGTKLLNVSQMTRGRRDGILKGEQVRYVVKIGAMNLKGVWIPFERAVELARAEGIFDELEPLFIHDIKSYYDRYYSKLDERQNPGAKAAALADQRRQQQLMQSQDGGQNAQPYSGSWSYTSQQQQQQHAHPSLAPSSQNYKPPLLQPYRASPQQPQPAATAGAPYYSYQYQPLPSQYPPQQSQSSGPGFVPPLYQKQTQPPYSGGYQPFSFQPLQQNPVQQLPPPQSTQQSHLQSQNQYHQGEN